MSDNPLDPGFFDDMSPDQVQDFLAAMAEEKQHIIGGQAEPVDPGSFSRGEDNRLTVQAEIERIQKLHGVKLTTADPEGQELARVLATETDPQKALQAVTRAAQAKAKRTNQAPLLRQYQAEIAQARAKGAGQHTILQIRATYRRKGLDL